MCWVVACVGLASFSQSLAGFGFSLLAVPLMQLAVSPRDAIVVATLIGTVSTVSQAVIDRRHVQRALAVRLTLSSFAGLPLGLLLFVLVSDRTLRIGLGVVVLLAVVALAKGFALREDQFVLDWLFGFMSGVLSTSTSTNGPPLVFVLQARKLTPQVFRATINTVFAYANLGALFLFLLSKKITQDNFLVAVISLPALLISLRVGYSLRPRVSAEFFRRLVLALMVLSGLSLLLKALL